MTPSEDQLIPLESLVDLETTKAAGPKDPSRPYVGLEHMASGSSTLLGSHPSSYSNGVNCVFEANDILFGKLRPNLRKCVLAPFGGFCSTDILVLRAKEGVNCRYASRVLQSEQVFRAAVATAAGTKMPRTSWGDLKRMKAVAARSAEEQGCIATILDLLDTALEQTERVIAKLRRVSVGLLRDLVTRGLDENGRLRDPTIHPEQFERSAFGVLPKGWGRPTLAHLCTHIGSGATPRGGEDVYVHSGVLFIRSQNVTLEGLNLDDVAHIPHDIHRAMKRSAVQAHDVLFNITGASIGRCCAMPEGLGEANVNQHVCILRVPDARDCDALLLSAVLGSPIGQRQLEALNTCGNRQGLNYQQLGAFVVPWAPADERKAIAAILACPASRIAQEEASLATLKAIKSGLIHDLLLGDVRTPSSAHLVGERGLRASPSPVGATHAAD